MMCGPKSRRLKGVMKRAAPSWGREDGGSDLRVQKWPRVPWGHRPAPLPTSRSSSAALALPEDYHGRDLGVSRLVAMRVRPLTRCRYAAALRMLLASLRMAAMPRVPWPRCQWDNVITDYLEESFDLGWPRSRVACLPPALLWARPELGAPVRKVLPSSAAALAGWQKLQPPASRPPLPRAVMMALAEELFKGSKPAMGLCLVLLFESYGRPSEMLALRPSSVVAPLLHGEGLALMWTIVFHAETFKQPGKMDVFDHSVALDLARHRWMGVLLGQWVARRASAEMLWDFTQVELGSALRRAAGRLGLAPLRPCLYQCRHGGASHDRLVGARPLLEVQQRGGWGSFQSVQRYEKHGRVGMEMQKLPIDKRNRLLEQERGSAGRCAVIFAAHFAQLRPVKGASSWTSSPGAATSRGRSGGWGKPSLPSTSCWGRSSTSLVPSSTPS